MYRLRGLLSYTGNWKISWRIGYFSCLWHWTPHLNWTVTADCIFIFWVESVRHPRKERSGLSSPSYNRHPLEFVFDYTRPPNTLEKQCQLLRSIMTVLCIFIRVTLIIPSPMISTFAQKWSEVRNSSERLLSGSERSYNKHRIHPMRRNQVGWAFVSFLVARATLQSVRFVI